MLRTEVKFEEKNKQAPHDCIQYDSMHNDIVFQDFDKTLIKYEGIVTTKYYLIKKIKYFQYHQVLEQFFFFFKSMFAITVLGSVICTGA